MRKRNIKSVAHWFIMTVLLLFPVTMVGISAFQNQSSNTEVHYNDIDSVNDFVIGETYYFNNRLGTYTDTSTKYTGKIFYHDLQVITTVNSGAQSAFDTGNNFTFYYSNESISIYINVDNTSIYNFTVSQTYGVSLTFVLDNYDSNYLGNNFSFLKSITYSSASYVIDVNDWVNGFVNLPVNAWYKQLMNVIGVGFTQSTVMNVIYVMPIYILWVYILDVIVDCFLVIINFGHNALHRLGGDNE